MKQINLLRAIPPIGAPALGNCAVICIWGGPARGSPEGPAAEETSGHLHLRRPEWSSEGPAVGSMGCHAFRAAQMEPWGRVRARGRPRPRESRAGPARLEPPRPPAEVLRPLAVGGAVMAALPLVGLRVTSGLRSGQLTGRTGPARISSPAL